MLPAQASRFPSTAHQLDDDLFDHSSCIGCRCTMSGTDKPSMELLRGQRCRCSQGYQRDYWQVAILRYGRANTCFRPLRSPRKWMCRCPTGWVHQLAIRSVYCQYAETRLGDLHKNCLNCGKDPHYAFASSQTSVTTKRKGRVLTWQKMPKLAK